MTVQSDLEVIAGDWIDEVFNLYQSYYYGEIPWEEFCNYAIESGFNSMARLKNFKWEE